MRIEKRGNEYLYYAADEWFDPSVMDAEELEHALRERCRGAICHSGYAAQGGYWMFEARTDMRYTCKELLFLAHAVSDLNVEGVKP
jgi:hypothetical protein